MAASALPPSRFFPAPSVPFDTEVALITAGNVSFGEPIHVAGRYDGVPLGRARREVTDQVMAAIQGLSGQEPAGAYNERAADA